MPQKRRNKINIQVMRSAKPKPKSKRAKRPKRNNRNVTSLGEIGSTIGSYFGPKTAKIGSNVGNFISKITGFGDYKVNANTLSLGQVPVFQTREREVIVAHKEFIADISGSTLFNLASFPINPGMATTFPWLSNIAAFFEQYEILGMIFNFRTTSGTSVSSTNTALGAVIMATDYDANHPVFTNKQQMDSYEFSCSDVPFHDIVHPIECKRSDKTLALQYIRTGAVNDDISFYDLGNFQIATQGMQNGVTTVGELWVSYHIRLVKPRMTIPVFSTQVFNHSVEGVASSATVINPFSAAGLVMANGSTLVVPSTNTSFYLTNAGSYSITIFWQNSSANITALATFTLGANLAYNNIMHGTGHACSPVGSSYMIAQLTITVNTPGNGVNNQVVINGLTGLNAANVDFFATLMPINIT